MLNLHLDTRQSLHDWLDENYPEHLAQYARYHQAVSEPVSLAMWLLGTYPGEYDEYRGRRVVVAGETLESIDA